MSRIVWFDAYISNVDRTARNPNMLIWHRKLVADRSRCRRCTSIMPAGGRRTPRSRATLSADQAARAAAQGQEPARRRRGDGQSARAETLQRIVDLIPGGWLAADDAPEQAAAMRTAYRDYLTERLTAPRAFIDEALRVR